MRKSQLQSKPRKILPSEVEGMVEVHVLEDGGWRFDKLKPGPKRKPRRPISQASPAQRSKVKAHGACIVCGREPEWDGVPLDPMHLIDRSLCPDPEGDPLRVVPGCRLCHGPYDDGELDLLPHLEPQWREELAEAVRLYGLIPTLQRVTNCRWRPDDEG